ncbi:MAG TPA: NUDIX domain-containing protein [Patescibacteria group bacterium]|nr:NUDIX domain-containing protein [Patescibacteria group bacterium]
MITCYFEDNAKAKFGLRHVVMSTIVVKDGKILLEKRGTYNGKPILESGKWALIGGYLDRDEDLITGAKRESIEETGWKLDNFKLLRINDSPERPREDRQNVDFVFVANAISQKPTKSEEVAELAWFDLDKIPPKEQIAFDHFESIELYKKFLKENFPIPLLG